MSSQSFADLGVSDAVCGALSKSGFDAPFAIQNLVIADVLAGRDVLAKSPTGSGKTLAFMVPLMDRIEATDARPAALVLAPTRELATQIVDATYKLAHARALRITAVYGGVGLEKQAKAAAQSHIVVATPGRLEDLLQRRAFTLKNIKVLVLDEADRMLDMGFRPAVDRIVNQCARNRQTLFFSATLDGEAGRIAREYTQDPVVHEHRPPEEKKGDIAHAFVKVDDERVSLLVRQLGVKRDLALVFVRTKRGADRLVKKLAGHDVQAVAMHGNKSQRQRERALAAFEAFEVDVLVATDVAARGIDVDDVSHVINFDPPEDRETYVHRTGRTGRAGRSGTAISLVGGEQAGDMAKIAKALGLDREWADSGLRVTHPSAGSGGGGTKGAAGGTKGAAGGAKRGGGSRGGHGSHGGHGGGTHGSASRGGHGGSSHGSRGGSHKKRSSRPGAGATAGTGGSANGKGPRGGHAASGGDGNARVVHSARPSGRGRSTR